MAMEPPPIIQPTPSSPSAVEFTRFRACDHCRRKKIKCDGRVTGCRNCITSNLQCLYNAPRTSGRKRSLATKQKRSGSEGSAGPAAAAELEERLNRIEQAIKEHLTNRLAHGDITSNIAPSAPHKKSTTRSDLVTEQSNRLYIWRLSMEDDSNMVGEDPEGLLEDFHGRIKFIGESSVLSVFLPRGLRWMTEKLGKDFEHPFCQAKMLEVAGNEHWKGSNPIMGSVDFFGGEETPLPPRPTVMQYVNNYMNRMNPWLPIYDRDQFLSELDYFYEHGEKAPPAWILSLNMIIAMGCRSTATQPSKEQWESEEKESWLYFRNACNGIPLVLFTNRDISAVQALLAMIVFLTETPNLESVFTLLGIATSIGNDLGIHRNSASQRFDPHEIEIRRKVFWVAYLMDKELSMRTGRPSTIVDNDFTVKLPSVNSPDDTPGQFFLELSKLARIQSKVARLLCSPRGKQTLPDSALLNAIALLDSELEQWRAGCGKPMEISVGKLKKRDVFECVHFLKLRLAYYSCSAAIRRPLSPAFDFPWDRTQPPQMALFEGFENCLQAARSALTYVDLVEELNFRVYRSCAISFICAAIILFTNILDDPFAECVRADHARILRLGEYLKTRVEAGVEHISELFFVTYTLGNLTEQLLEKISYKGFNGAAEVEGDEWVDVGAFISLE
ncbi:hypothetical protein L873DRAFT_1847231 [Choiromyces venosus 120613-1]|uniref:Zn(2)-C6 fungal-type domain-containing protein n=1 Tax=Choiromyces venosus 120613-1 TaxID=1336337 RepID=A0A3N4J5K9_9PEZI|nr:hypothetical protein L873DRAFT_1847231 [Choiromyces venosus 120613-1]